MTWSLFRGDGQTRSVSWSEAPPWRRFPVASADVGGPATFQTTPELVVAVNASLHLRRPLLLTGRPGSGKSSVAEAIAHELGLGPVLRWHVNSRSTLDEAIYRYDALGRLQHNQLEGTDEISQFLRLGPLGTALVASAPDQPRVLLIDELDKGELDLPGDLLTVFERGEHNIPELHRLTQTQVEITGDDNDETYLIERGWVRCREFPVVVMTSNGEREFPAPFLRRCVRLHLNPPDIEQLTRIVAAHFGTQTASTQQELIEIFAQRLTRQGAASSNLAIDQLLNAVHVLTGDPAPKRQDREQLVELLLRELDRT